VVGIISTKEKAYSFPLKFFNKFFSLADRDTAMENHTLSLENSCQIHHRARSVFSSLPPRSSAPPYGEIGNALSVFNRLRMNGLTTFFNPA
jgi:hypothetical protein